MKAKYPINSEESFIDPYANYKTGEIVWHTLKKGKIIDIQETANGVTYTVDPAPSGHYGHKRYGVLEKDIHPTDERIEECKKIAPVKTCQGWRMKNSSANSQAARPQG
jgi:hypothetical protein